MHKQRQVLAWNNWTIFVGSITWQNIVVFTQERNLFHVLNVTNILLSGLNCINTTNINILVCIYFKVFLCLTFFDISDSELYRNILNYITFIHDYNAIWVPMEGDERNSSALIIWTPILINPIILAHNWEDYNLIERQIKVVC